MTGPQITNEELLALAADQEVEGGEMTQIIQAVVALFGQISSQLATALSLAVSDENRAAIKTSLTNAKALSDNGEAALNALLAPPA